MKDVTPPGLDPDFTMAEAAADADVRIVTFGCRLNAYESEVIRAQAAKDGLENAVRRETRPLSVDALITVGPAALLLVALRGVAIYGSCRRFAPVEDPRLGRYLWMGLISQAGVTFPLFLRHRREAAGDGLGPSRRGCCWVSPGWSRSSRRSWSC